MCNSVADQKRNGQHLRSQLSGKSSTHFHHQRYYLIIHTALSIRKHIFRNDSAPKLFTVIYNMMRPFMHQVTIDKVCVYGFDKNEWKSALLKDIDADQLPEHYGGTMTDPATGDPKCPHKVI